MSANTSKRILLGLVFIAVGTLFIVRLTGLFPIVIPPVLVSWKMILIILGIIFLVSDSNKTTGLILLTIGVVFMAGSHFGLAFWQMMRYALPVFLIVAGILLLMPGRNLLSGRRYHRQTESMIDTIDEVNIFSGGTKMIHTDNFSGGEITCIFGGSELNFKNAKLAPGKNVLDVTCIFGGVTLYVPEDWTVKLEAATVFGGFSDTRAKSGLQMVTDPDKVLFVKGVFVFGGGEIKFI